MQGTLILAYIARWIHIACATIAIGAPVFIRFALMPAAGKVLDAEAHQRLRESINARWRHIVYLIITLFIITGSYQFFVPTRVNGVLITARWKDFAPRDQATYQMFFGIKMLAAFSLFFLISVLAGRTRTFAPIRNKARLFVNIVLVLAVIVLICALGMHFLPVHATVAQAAGAATRP